MACKKVREFVELLAEDGLLNLSGDAVRNYLRMQDAERSLENLIKPLIQLCESSLEVSAVKVERYALGETTVDVVQLAKDALAEFRKEWCADAG